jgi:uncharacterized membrane protein YesL
MTKILKRIAMFEWVSAFIQTNIFFFYILAGYLVNGACPVDRQGTPESKYGIINII